MNDNLKTRIINLANAVSSSNISPKEDAVIETITILTTPVGENESSLYNITDTIQADLKFDADLVNKDEISQACLDFLKPLIKYNENIAPRYSIDGFSITIDYGDDFAVTGVINHDTITDYYIEKYEYGKNEYSQVNLKLRVVGYIETRRPLLNR